MTKKSGVSSVTRSLFLACLVLFSVVTVLDVLAVCQTTSTDPTTATTAGCWQGLKKVEYPTTTGFPACRCFLSYPVVQCGIDCTYIKYVDVIDASTGEIMSIFGPTDFFGDNGQVTRGVTTADGRPWAVSEGYATDSRHSAELFVRDEGGSTVLYLCSPYANRFRIKLWCWDPTTCRLNSCYIAPEGPCVLPDSSKECAKPHFGSATLWIVVDNEKLAALGTTSSELLSEIDRALRPAFGSLSRRFANEAAVGKSLWELTDRDWAPGKRSYMEFRVHTDRCLDDVLRQIRAILAKYNLSLSVQDRRAFITTS